MTSSYTAEKTIVALQGPSTALATNFPWVVSFQGPTSDYGDTIFEKLTTVDLINFAYGLDKEMTIPLLTLGGTATSTNTNLLDLSVTSAIGSTAGFRSKTRVRNYSGKGILVRFTAIFGAPQIGNTQIIGPLSSEDGLAFSTNPSTGAFGVQRRYGGVKHVETLTITTAITTTGTCIIQLAGITGPVAVNVPVTFIAGATTQYTAHQISLIDFTEQGLGYDVFPEGNTVVFLTRRTISANHSNFTFNANGTGITASFGASPTITGILATNEYVPKTLWNVDTCNGNGPSGFVLDQTKGNTYEIYYSWSNFGIARFYVLNPTTGNPMLVHRMTTNNTSTTPLIVNNGMPLIAANINTTNVSLASSLKISLMLSSVEGDRIFRYFGHPRSFSASKSVSGSTAETVLIALRPKLIFHGKTNFGDILFTSLSTTTSGNKSITFNIIKNPTFSNNATINWTQLNNVTNSFMLFSGETTNMTITTGIRLFSFTLRSTNDQVTTELINQGINITFGDIICITAKPSSSTTSDYDASINWIEDF